MKAFTGLVCSLVLLSMACSLSASSSEPPSLVGLCRLLSEEKTEGMQVVLTGKPESVLGYGTAEEPIKYWSFSGDGCKITIAYRYSAETSPPELQPKMLTLHGEWGTNKNGDWVVFWDGIEYLE